MVYDGRDDEGVFFHDELKRKMDEYVHSVYNLTKVYPSHEIFGVTSQIRRSSLSVILNYIEGYARRRSSVYKNFLEISYASLKESSYLLDFSLEEKYIQDFEKYN
ncbi:four helix bundle protein [Patescibacteria group bacterium]|nr:four helix bundle protein [Patescibacteria group bacterium]